MGRGGSWRLCFLFTRIDLAGAFLLLLFCPFATRPRACVRPRRRKRVAPKCRARDIKTIILDTTTPGELSQHERENLKVISRGCSRGAQLFLPDFFDRLPPRDAVCLLVHTWLRVGAHRRSFRLSLHLRAKSVVPNSKIILLSTTIITRPAKSVTRGDAYFYSGQGLTGQEIGGRLHSGRAVNVDVRLPIDTTITACCFLTISGCSSQSQAVDVKFVLQNAI